MQLGVFHEIFLSYFRFFVKMCISFYPHQNKFVGANGLDSVHSSVWADISETVTPNFLRLCTFL